MDVVLAALGWATPQRARDADRRIIKVYRVNVYYELPRDVAESLRSGPRYSPTVFGCLVATSKADAAAKVYGHPLRSGRNDGIREIEPTDLAYPIAVAHPDSVVIMHKHAPTLVPLAELESR